MLDPVEAFADLARRTGLYLHVDAAFGGFILPFMRDLGHPIPPFDLSLDGVSSISTDGHKLGLLPIATGFFLVRDAAILEAIPTERTLIHTTSSTKPGSRAAAAWATFKHLGREGYVRSTAHVLALRDIIAEGVTAIPGMTPGGAAVHLVVGFTSNDDRPRAASTGCWPRTAGGRATASPAASRSSASRSIRRATSSTRTAFVAAFEDAVARTRRA